MLESEKILEKILREMKAQALAHNMDKFEDSSDEIRMLFQAWSLPGGDTRWENLGLTYTEHAVMEYLFARLGRVVNREAVHATLYPGADAAGIKIIDVFICKLRKKLAKTGSEYRIQNARGRGYIMVGPTA